MMSGFQLVDTSYQMYDLKFLQKIRKRVHLIHIIYGYHKNCKGLSHMMIKYANLVLRFLLELCALFALGYWGFHTGKSLILKIVLAFGAPLIVAVVWGIFGSPGAPVKLSAPLHLLLELMVFGLPIVALYAAGKPGLSFVFGLVVIINRSLMYIWKQ
jgi:hypothetical protein